MRLSMMFAVTISVLTASGCMAAQGATPTYLRPGTPQVGGVNDLCLIYHGRKSNVQWTERAIMPYVAYVDEQGHPKDWLFDSFLFMEFATDSGAWLHFWTADGPHPTFADWQWLADAWFRPQTGLIGLERAVARAGRALGDPNHVVKVVIALPIPLVQERAFGPLPGETESLDLSSEANRERAMRWYIDEVMRRWGERKYPHLQFVGFYWTAEEIGADYRQTTRWTSKHLHDRGLRLYWIPCFGAGGITQWRDCGFDAIMLQPNHFFTETADVGRLQTAARVAQTFGSGIEIEFDGRALTSDDYLRRFWGYLDAGVKYGWMNNAVLGYYEGGSAIKLFSETPGLGRQLYDAVYRFVKGTYTPSGKVDLPDLPVIERDMRANLALASNGAHVTGAIVNPQYPELAPEKIIDGEILMYGGMSGFGYFGIPGSVTIELPKAGTVARTQTMLFVLDGRTFQYTIETSVDGKSWSTAVDKSQGEWGGWQVDEFAPRKARFVRLSGLHNSVNDLFQIVELEVYSSHLQGRK